MPFYNRKSELEGLKKHLSSTNSEMIILEGRRRIGKTELIKQLLSQHEEKIYFFVNITERKLGLEEFSHTIAREIGDTIHFDTPTQLYDYLADQSAKAKKKFIVVFDEFQRFEQVDKS